MSMVHLYDRHLFYGIPYNMVQVYGKCLFYGIPYVW